MEAIRLNYSIEKIFIEFNSPKFRKHKFLTNELLLRKL